MWETLNRNEQYVGEVLNYTKDKKDYWIRLTIDPLFDEKGNKIGYSSYRENITDKKELEYISTHDSLTDLYNRSYFQQALEAKIKVAKKYDQEFGFVMFDIDHFKNVNDTFGHHVGDEVLKMMAECIESNITKDDIVARWGGEEFIIISNNATIDSLIKLIEKLQFEIRNISFNPVSNVTVSFGLTVYKDGDCMDSIQKRADDALYKAKDNGRDRYEIL